MRHDLIEHARDRIARDGYECPLAVAVTVDKLIDSLVGGDGRAVGQSPDAVAPILKVVDDGQV